MRQDLRLSAWCLTGKDFYEGVRAVIIDKDNAPQWDPADLDAVSDNDIAAAFDALDAEHEMTFLGETESA